MKPLTHQCSYYKRRFFSSNRFVFLISILFVVLFPSINQIVKHELTNDDNELKISLENYLNGIYLVKLINYNKVIATQKLITLK